MLASSAGKTFGEALLCVKLATSTLLAHCQPFGVSKGTRGTRRATNAAVLRLELPDRAQSALALPLTRRELATLACHTARFASSALVLTSIALHTIGVTTGVAELTSRAIEAVMLSCVAVPLTTVLAGDTQCTSSVPLVLTVLMRALCTCFALSCACKATTDPLVACWASVTVGA